MPYISGHQHILFCGHSASSQPPFCCPMCVYLTASCMLSAVYVLAKNVTKLFTPSSFHLISYNVVGDVFQCVYVYTCCYQYILKFGLKHRPLKCLSQLSVCYWPSVFHTRTVVMNGRWFCLYVSMCAEWIAKSV